MNITSLSKESKQNIKERNIIKPTSVFEIYMYFNIWFNLRPQVPMARASILWLIGEYCEHVPKIAPDVLRKMAKSFTNEEDIVKLQIINLAAKLYLTNSKQVLNKWHVCITSV